MPDIVLTVAICTWNRAESLRQTLECFTTVDHPDAPWELLVVNNNSTDATDAVVASFAERLPVRLLQEPRTGQSFARNLAVSEARGRIIAWTDDDVILSRDWMPTLLAAFQQHAADFVFGRAVAAWPGGVTPTWYAERFRGNFALLDYGPECRVITDRHEPFFGLNFAGTADAHRALGDFRTDFGLKQNVGGVGEDVDFFLRALGQGMRVVYQPRACVSHVIAEERVHKRYHRRRQWVANTVYYQALSEIFPGAPTLLGLPRFFYPKMVSDSMNYLKYLVRGNTSERFFYELQILRFVKLFIEAGRHGWKPAPGAQA